MSLKNDRITLRKLRVLADRLQKDHHENGTKIRYSLSDSSISGNDPDEAIGLYHLVIPFCDFEVKRKNGLLPHCNLDYIYIKTGERFRHEKEQSGELFASRFVPYAGFLRMTYFQERDGQLLGRCSDGYSYKLPLDTPLYIEHRKIYQGIETCIKLLLVQQNQR